MVDYLELRGGDTGPLLHFQDGSPLTRTRLVSSLRTVLAQAHVPVDEATFSGHSFRIGVATTAAKKRVEDSMIRLLGCWESGAYQRYIQTLCDQLARVCSDIIFHFGKGSTSSSSSRVSLSGTIMLLACKPYLAVHITSNYLVCNGAQFSQDF